MNKIILWANDASVTGSLRVLDKPVTYAIHYWNNTEDIISWNCMVTYPGQYVVEINYSLASEMIGGTFSIVVGEVVLLKSAIPTQGWQDFKTFNLGFLTIHRGGAIKVEMQAVHMPDATPSSMPDVACSH